MFLHERIFLTCFRFNTFYLDFPLKKHHSNAYNSFCEAFFCIYGNRLFFLMYNMVKTLFFSSRKNVYFSRIFTMPCKDDTWECVEITFIDQQMPRKTHQNSDFITFIGFISFRICSHLLASFNLLVKFFIADTLHQVKIPWHYCYSLCMNGTKKSIFKKSDQVRLGRLLECHYCS